MRGVRNGILGAAALLLSWGIATQVHTFAAPATAKHVKILTKEGGPAGFMFSPAKKTISVGTTVTWTNTSSQVPHNITSMTPSWHFVKDLGPSASVSYTFKKKGTYKYQCTIHPGMKATIVVK
jgi:plastocyanin